MSENAKKNVLISIAALLIGGIVVTGATFALFTGKSTVNNHLKAGNLTVGLYRTSYETHALTKEGLLETSAADTTRVDLTKDAKQLFTVANAVPESWYKAAVEVSNDGSVAFEYGMRILWNEGGKASADEVLFASQMEITLTYGEEQTEVFMLNQSGDKDIALGKLLQSEKASFTVKAEFKNDPRNDEVQNTSVDFDIQVYATQSTSNQIS